MNNEEVAELHMKEHGSRVFVAFGAGSGHVCFLGAVAGYQSEAKSVLQS